MSIEYEAKILDIEVEGFTGRIRSIGGEAVDSRIMRRYVYDIVPGDPSKWIRLRDDGISITLATKHILHDGIDGTEEYEVEVDSFEETHELLGTLGFTAKAYQENLRNSFELDGARLELDVWPRIPAYLEIEASSKAEVIRIARLLGYTEDQLTGENTTKVYARYGIDLTTISELRFIR